MSATITAGNGAGATSPLLILLPIEPENESGNVIHDLIGGGIAVSLVDPRPRSGELLLLYGDESTAQQSYELHRAKTTFTLDWPARAMLDGLVYIVTRLRPVLDEGTRVRWVVHVGYQEVGSA